MIDYKYLTKIQTDINLIENLLDELKMINKTRHDERTILRVQYCLIKIKYYHMQVKEKLECVYSLNVLYDDKLSADYNNGAYSI
jgi:hypothetical protein